VALEVLAGGALEAAWDDAVARLGAEPASWAWGRTHRAFFEHPLAFTPERQAVMNLPDVPRGGDGTTPNATGSGARQTSGASYREVLDLSDWDRSTATNVPGLSGQPGSVHYGDLLPLWAEGRYYPLPFSRAAVERHATARLRLVPTASY
jgi:penicillin amidase